VSGTIISIEKKLRPAEETVALSSLATSLSGAPLPVAISGTEMHLAGAREEAGPPPKLPTNGRKAQETAEHSSKLAFKIPPILLEGDEPSPSPISGPGQKYELGAIAPAAAQPAATGALPPAYGTQKLFLAARDPHWLYAYWDLTDEQQQQHNSLALHQHLVLRIRAETALGAAPHEVHLNPESRHWFVYVANGGTKYLAELGYYDPNGQWVMVAASEPAMTPPDNISEDKTLEFATVAEGSLAPAPRREIVTPRVGAELASGQR